VSLLNRYEETILSILIIMLVIAFSFGHLLYTDGRRNVRGGRLIEIYSRVQSSLLNGSIDEVELRDAYVMVVLNGTVLYEFGDSDIISSERYVFPLFINGSLGEMVCWVREGG
jgi:hypothetical protein